MKIACTIFLYTSSDHRFLWLAKQLIDSIRKYDDIPITVLAPKRRLSELAYNTLKKMDVPIWEEPLIWAQCWLPYELTKIQVFKHDEYDKILLLDADAIARKSIKEVFEYPSISAPNTNGEPFQAAKIVLKPNYDDYVNLIRLMKSGFSYHNGWNKHGKFNHWLTGEKVDWHFNCAESSQGLLYYYFHLIKKSYFPNPISQINHVGMGTDKWKLTNIVPKTKLL